VPPVAVRPIDVWVTPPGRVLAHSGTAIPKAIVIAPTASAGAPQPPNDEARPSSPAIDRTVTVREEQQTNQSHRVVAQCHQEAEGSNRNHCNQNLSEGRTDGITGGERRRYAGDEPGAALPPWLRRLLA